MYATNKVDTQIKSRVACATTHAAGLEGDGSVQSRHTSNTASFDVGSNSVVKQGYVVHRSRSYSVVCVYV